MVIKISVEFVFSSFYHTFLYTSRIPSTKLPVLLEISAGYRYNKLNNISKTTILFQKKVF